MTLSYEQGLIEAHRMIPSFYSFNERGEVMIARHMPAGPAGEYGSLITYEAHPSVEPKDTDTNEEEGA